MSTVVGPASAAPSAAAIVPSMPLAPRLASTRGPPSSRAGAKVSTSRTGIEAATTSVSAGGRAGRRRTGGEVAGDARLAGAPAERLVDRERRGRVGGAPGGQPLLVGRRQRGELGQRGGGVAVEERAEHGGGVVPAAPRREGALRDVAEGGEPLAQRLGCRQVADAH